MAREPGIRLWPLAVIAALAALSLCWIWLLADLTRSWAVVYTGQTLLLTIAGILLWLALWSRLARRTRIIWLVLLITPLVLTAVVFRIDTVSGDLIPTLAWRFRAKPHEALAANNAGHNHEAEVASPIDLMTTTPRDYPRYLGGRDAMFRDVRLATDWNAHPPRVVWRQPIGAGWSSFAVVGNYAVTQEQRGPQELVTCYELQTGKLLWSLADDVYYESKIAGDGPRATPTIDHGRVFALGSTGLLNCLDGGTGKRLWQRDTFADTSRANTDWGKACSPLVVNDLVIVTGGAAEGPALVAYDISTGELAWRADDHPTSSDSYSSPTLLTLAEVRQIVMVNDNTVCGYDPATGKQLWEHPWPGDEPKATQPLKIDDYHLVVGSGYGVGSALLEFSPAADGKLAVHEVWANRNLKPKFTNLIHRNGYLYGLDEGILTCLDLKTGKRKWKQGRYGHGQIALVDDVILVLAEDSTAVLVAATPENHRELARFAVLEGKSWSHPVLVPPYLLVRNDQEAACYQLVFETP